jgi:hypothetical protein
MRYIVIGNSAVLATRGIERARSDNTLPIVVENVPDGSSITIISKNGYQNTFQITSESTLIDDLGTLNDDVFYVTVNWSSLDEKGITVKHVSDGNPFLINTDANGRYVTAAPLASTADMDRLWQGIVDVLDVLLPLADDVRNGVNVI